MSGRASLIYQLMSQISILGAAGSPGLSTTTTTTVQPTFGSTNQLHNPANQDGGVGDSTGGGGLCGGGGSSGGGSRRGSGRWGGGGSSHGESRRGSNNESLFAASLDTDPSESSFRTGAKLAASAIGGVEDEEEGIHATEGVERSFDWFGWGSGSSRGAVACDVEGEGVGAGDIGEPAVERRNTSSRLSLFPGVDEGMGCIEEEPEQLDT